MGGWNSGRSGGGPIAEHALRIDLAWMIRTGRAVPGSHISSSLHWTCGGEPSGNIGYEAIMTDPDNSRLILTYTKGRDGARENVRQEIRLVHTQPHYGGKRWWMICPYGGGRCAKLFLPGNGDRFASRKAWRIGYRSQRVAGHDKPFERLNRLQRKLGCNEGYDEYPFRPKGMWQRTYERHMARYEEISDQCDYVWAGMMARLGVFR